MAKKKLKMPSEREATLLQILVQREKYGLELSEEYEKLTGERMPAGSLYVTLDRMESAGFIRSRMGEETHERGGNRRKYFKLTGDGAEALNQHRERLTSALQVFGLKGTACRMGVLSGR